MEEEKQLFPSSPHIKINITFEAIGNFPDILALIINKITIDQGNTKKLFTKANTGGYQN